ncbi:MAG: sulfite oxidase heme-binding subunit YedZ [Chloroflexota bacterium]
MVLKQFLQKCGLQIVTHLGALTPLLLLAWKYWQGAFLIDPVREITTATGKTALILLLLALACTPINTVFGFRGVVRVRRALGLYAFFYAGLHFFTFVGLDYQFDGRLIRQAVLEQRYVLAGTTAGLLMLPLAITSTKGWQRRLGKNWKRLHRLVYLSGALAVVHFLWLVKDSREPMRYGLLLALLLLLRWPAVRRTVSHLRHRLATRRTRPEQRLT